MSDVITVNASDTIGAGCRDAVVQGFGDSIMLVPDQANTRISRLVVRSYTGIIICASVVNNQKFE